MLAPPLDPIQFAARANEVATLLAVLASPPRLMLLCKLAETGEMRVGALAEAVGLSQSALSQHLARLRAEGLVVARRAGQSISYRIADARVLRLMDVLHTLYCSQES
ncbi:MAG: ArsR/SmtB family transcription factor [Sandaracinobacteroides sp.]